MQVLFQKRLICFRDFAKLSKGRLFDSLFFINLKEDNL